MELSKNKIFNSDKNFIYGFVLITIVFLITRLPYFLYYPVLSLSADTAAYIAVAFDLLNSQPPLFDIRTPGYPVFLYIFWLFSKNVFIIIAAQSLLVYLSLIFFLRAINKTYKSYTLLFAISLCGYVSSSYFLLLEISLQTEALFISFLLFISGFLILSLKLNKLQYWILFSVSSAILILIRPAGLFVISLIVLLCIYFFVNNFSVKYYLAVVIPFSFIIFSLCAYNYFTLKKFTITPFGESNISGLTILFMEPSDEYPEFVNKSIRETLTKVPTNDISYVKNSFSITKYYNVFLENYNKQMDLLNSLIKYDTSSVPSDYQLIIRKISLDAIKKYPEIYCKFFICNFYLFFINTTSELNYFENIASVYKSIVIGNNLEKYMDKRLMNQISSDKSVIQDIRIFYENEIAKQMYLDMIDIKNNTDVELKPTFMMGLFKVYEKISNLIFRNILWIILFFVMFFICSYKLLRSKFKDIDSLIPFLFGMLLISKAVMISLVEVSLIRYSYTMEFVIYFSLPFLFILLKNSKNKINNNNQ